MSTATSSSDRYDDARKILARYDAIESDDDPGYHDRVDAAIDALGILRALVTPPATMETVEAIAERIATSAMIDTDDAYDVAVLAVHAGIQAAWESWEPENAPGVRVATWAEAKEIRQVIEDLRSDVVLDDERPNAYYETRIFDAFGITQ